LLVKHSPKKRGSKRAKCATLIGEHSRGQGGGGERAVRGVAHTAGKLDLETKTRSLRKPIRGAGTE